MDSLPTATRLARCGRFLEALETISHTKADHERVAERVLRAEILERLGRHGQSRSIAESVLRSKDATQAERSRVELVLGLIAWEGGSTDGAIEHLQRSISYARQSGESERACWAQLQLLLLVGDRSGPNSVTPLLAELRRNTTTLGEPMVTAAYHVFVATMDARRGLLKSAESHAQRGLALLAGAPNAWLEILAENIKLTTAIVLSDIDTARTSGHRGAAIAEKSGAASAQRAILGNLGNLYYLLGDFDLSLNYFERAIAALPSAGQNSSAVLDSICRIKLAQGRFEECANLLERKDESIQHPKDRVAYVHRQSLLTRIQLLSCQERWPEALEQAEMMLALAAEAGDQLLSDVALLTKAELLQHVGLIPEALSALDRVVGRLAVSPPNLYAHYERIFACALAANGDPDAARVHYDRAKRVYESLHSAPGLLELSRSWSRASRQSSASPIEAARPGEAGTASAEHAHPRLQTIFQSAAALMLHAGRPELLAREIVKVFADTECILHASAISRGDDGGTPEVLATTNPSPISAEQARRIPIGIARQRTVEVLVTPKADPESQATLNAVLLLLAAVHEIERGRAEREERLTLWPIEDVPTECGNAVVGGQMRELMNMAKKIATTNVSVLITGESGTGKEVLARAIHAYSDRAGKPFIPFNCTAVPREMLESQLFGHRRGAFTGADRDSPGLIRSARDGTLFLDEIGELGLDMQPKLLRFLESGEISPLGESTPITVRVRIIAATNSNLEQLVNEGRFREDLFYRLNVIRLRIPPLRERRDEIPALVHHFAREAAVEFRKEHIRVGEEAMERLLLYSWPGNVRQLNNELRRMVALAEPNSVLGVATLSDAIAADTLVQPRRAAAGEIAVPLHDKLMPTLSKIECEMIKAALREHRGKVDAAAKALGITRNGLYHNRQRLGL